MGGRWNKWVHAKQTGLLPGRITPLPQLPFISPRVMYVVHSSRNLQENTRVAAASKMVERRAFQKTPQTHQMEVTKPPDRR